MSFVRDHSVAMRGVSSARRILADGILKRPAAGEDALVPVLWFYKASAVLSPEQNRDALAAPKAEAFIAELQALRIAADAECAARVFSDVHRLALTYRLTSLRCGISGVGIAVAVERIVVEYQRRYFANH